MRARDLKLACMLDDVRKRCAQRASRRGGLGGEGKKGKEKKE